MCDQVHRIKFEIRSVPPSGRACKRFDEKLIFLTLPPHLRRLLRRRLRLDQRLCLLAVLAGAVDASGLLQVGRPGQ